MPDSLFVPATSTPLTNMPSTLDLLTMDMKPLVKKIQALSHLGIEDQTITLPKICVVGDQSAGKSSLIEGISEIKVPRDSNTCTRCPMEINLYESEPGESWKCVVYVSRRYCYDPAKRMRDPSSQTKYLGPWLPFNGQDDEMFVTLTDRSKVKEAIKWAQIAILNPEENPQNFVPGKNHHVSGATKEKFSPNVVRLDISAPGFANLSFYDLPGVINVPEQEDETYLVGLVERLVKQYASQENCILLLTMAMTDDATNSSAARIISNIKSAKSRTLGVLTKPDRVSANEPFAQWEDILQGKTFKLGHGYYVVRNNPDPNVDHRKAREEEEAFFSDPFWSGMMVTFQHRFGVRRLQTALSAVLMEQIQKCLPSIICKINEKAASVDRELKTLPDPPAENVQRVLTEKVTILGLKFREVFDDKGLLSSVLHSSWGNLIKDFQMALAITKPTLITVAESDREVFAERIDSDCEIVSPSPSRLKRKAPTTETKPSSEELAHSANFKESVYHSEEFQRWKGPSRRFSLDEIRNIREQSHRAGIPNQIDSSAIEALEKQSVKHWDEITKKFVVATHSLVMRILSETLDEVIASEYHQTGLYRELKRITDAFVMQLGARYLTDAIAQYKIEFEKPFTMAEDRHRQAMQQALAQLCNGRQKSRARAFLRSHGADHTDEGNVAKVIKEYLGPEPYDLEMSMMANSRGYYEIASSRFVDVICQKAYDKLFLKCRDDLITAIDVGLDANTTERCMELMAEDPERQARRNLLTKERAKLTKAQEWLATICHQADDDDVVDSPDQTICDASPTRNECKEEDI
ncbi:hypothetical protein N7462_010708 [Penicillium macrosclerotiorum]|uniref:uncharacterized protein n=1 Tax=Penicillium macrosclerotiorum TaxID=303699 RepID=UPI002547558C|nr:uncharacterized protein N7462_010708 [Penicillium macrosclerotiorum]KAJ5669638.1 hypothetical protein N7462_010708 [Penicillium macrosclerotiorum]